MTTIATWKYDLMMCIIFAVMWYFGFITGRWWERINKEEMPDNDEELW